MNYVSGCFAMNYRILRTLHVYSSVVVLALVLFFAVTGITLNHRDWFTDRGSAVEEFLPVPDTILQATDWQARPLDGADALRRWLTDQHGLTGGTVIYDWDTDEQMLLIDIKRPGGYSSVEFSPFSAEVTVFHQRNGLVAVMNDLHMGRYSGIWWRLLLDITALIMLVFIVTGLWLVVPQKKRRRTLFKVAAAGTGVLAAGYWIALLP